LWGRGRYKLRNGSNLRNRLRRGCRDTLRSWLRNKFRNWNRLRNGLRSGSKFRSRNWLGGNFRNGRRFRNRLGNNFLYWRGCNWIGYRVQYFLNCWRRRSRFSNRSGNRLGGWHNNSGAN
jgi:hypothetical protein